MGQRLLAMCKAFLLNAVAGKPEMHQTLSLH